MENKSPALAALLNAKKEMELRLKIEYERGFIDGFNLKFKEVEELSLIEIKKLMDDSRIKPDIDSCF